MLKNLGITYYNPVSTVLFTDMTSCVYKLMECVHKSPQLDCPNPDLSMLYSTHRTCLRCILTFCSVTCLCLPGGLFSSGFGTWLLCAFLILQPCMPHTPISSLLMYTTATTTTDGCGAGGGDCNWFSVCMAVLQMLVILWVLAPCSVLCLFWHAEEAATTRPPNDTVSRFRRLFSVYQSGVPVAVHNCP
jgi:hypothetical protein